MQNRSWYDVWERESWKKSIEKCTKRNDWPNYKEQIDKDIDLLRKREVFRLVVYTPKSINQVGYK